MARLKALYTGYEESVLLLSLSPEAHLWSQDVGPFAAIISVINSASANVYSPGRHYQLRRLERVAPLVASTHQLAKLSLLTGFSQCQLSFVIWCTVFIYHGHQGPGLHCISFVHFLPPLGQPALKILFPLCYSSVLFFLETWPQDSSYKFLTFFSFIEAPQLQHLLECSMHTSSKCMFTLQPFSQCPLPSSFQQHPHLS